MIALDLGVKAQDVMAVAQRRGLSVRALIANRILAPPASLGLPVWLHAMVAFIAFLRVRCAPISAGSRIRRMTFLDALRMNSTRKGC